MPATSKNNQETNTLAIISFICGILSFIFLGVIGAILAIVLSILAKKEIAAKNQSGAGLAKAGLILGIINIVVSIIIVILVLILVLGVGIALF